MISIVESGNVYDFRGKSTDTKPTYILGPQNKKKLIGTGSSFFEIDTGIIYWFDSETKKWNAF